MKELISDMNTHPEILHNHPNFYEYSPDEQREDLLKRAQCLYKLNKEKYFTKYNPVAPPTFNWWMDMYQGLMPGIGLNNTMGNLSV